MMTTYNEIVAYLESIPALIPGIKSVTVGADEEVMSLQNSRIKYPHLWVETPAISFVGTDHNPGIRFDLGINILAGEGLKTNKAGNTRLSETLNLLSLLYTQMLADSDNDLFDLILKSDAGDPIRRWSADNVYGWRLEISIEIPRIQCGPPIDVWAPDPITGDTYEYTVPAGRLLVAIYLRSDQAQTAMVGTSPGAEDIGSTIPALADSPIIWAGLNLYAANDITLYFTGLAGTNVLKVWTTPG